jgi:ribose transport system permease protein
MTADVTQGKRKRSQDQPAPAAGSGTERLSRVAEALGPRNIGSVYVLVVICVVFGLWIPGQFLSIQTVQQVLNSYSITALAALAIVVPLSARVFDLSFAYTMSLSGVVTAHYIASSNMPIFPAILLGLCAGLVVGLLNGFVVVVMRIDSFIGTLATGSLVQAFISLVTNDSSITSQNLATGAFAKLSEESVGGVTIPVLYVIILALILWVYLEHTPGGRRLYATGFNPEAARLANIRINRIRFGSLIASSLIAGIAGIVLASNISAGSPTGGTPYLLPAYAAAFVGATQLKGGRFNAWGTVIAVVMLGTGVIGLGLASAPAWAADMFTGVVLIAALGITGAERRARSASGWLPPGLLASLRRSKPEPPDKLASG